MTSTMTESKRLDPRNLISPPYRTCPKCSHGNFGVLIISGARYTRRCRDCWHTAEFPLPKLRKKIIYLDQFVISNLMKLKNPATPGHTRVVSDRFWQELHDLLFQLRHLQLICCPDSGSHEEESLTSPFNADLKKMYESLSGGISFNRFDGIKSQQIGELALAWPEGREPKFDFDPRSVLSRDPNDWNERFYIVMGDNPFMLATNLRQVRADLHANIGRLFRDVWGAEKRTFAYWYELERAGYQGYLGQAVVKSRREGLEAILAYRPGVEIPLQNLEKVLPSFAEGLAASLEHIFRFPRDGTERSLEDADRLEKDFGKANRIADAPFVKLQSLMYAAVAMRAAGGQKEPPNEGTTTDVDTVAHLLPYCDAMFMDNGCRSLLLDVPEDLRPADVEKVFSLNSKVEFLDYLRGIRASISAEQLHAIRDVYGERYAESLTANADKLAP
jgi:hypothetical protein